MRITIFTFTESFCFTFKASLAMVLPQTPVCRPRGLGTERRSTLVFIHNLPLVCILFLKRPLGSSGRRKRNNRSGHR